LEEQAEHQRYLDSTSRPQEIRSQNDSWVPMPLSPFNIFTSTPSPLLNNFEKSPTPESLIRAVKPPKHPVIKVEVSSPVPSAANSYVTESEPALGQPNLDNYLSGPYNYGDRFNPRTSLRHIKNITKATFETDSTPSQLFLYPRHLSPEAATPDHNAQTNISFPPFSEDQLAELLACLQVPTAPPTPSPNFNSHIPSGKHVYGHICQPCGINFDRKERTIAHYSTFHHRDDVTNLNSHPCDHRGCNRSFRYPKDLHRHGVVHTGEKPYSCVCGSSYTKQCNLTRHQKGCNNFISTREA